MFSGKRKSIFAGCVPNNKLGPSYDVIRCFSPKQTQIINGNSDFHSAELIFSKNFALHVQEKTLLQVLESNDVKDTNNQKSTI